MKILVTGGMGFIGSNFIRQLLTSRDDIEIVNLDKLTYAGNPANLKNFDDDERHTFVHGDICDPKTVDQCMADATHVVHFAAETHVDRAIHSAGEFIQTDVYGTFVLLEHAKKYGVERFVQISTDEVYGQVPIGTTSKETDALMPRNPYSASKAGADRLAYSYWATYGLPVIITRASNNYGPYQYPEKLIPLFVTNLIEGKKVPVYGDGKQIRDWLHVSDHCTAIEFILDHGVNGEVYNVGGENEKMNIEITRIILDALDRGEEMIEYVQDRPGHDRRYALDCSKIKALGWQPETPFEDGMRATIEWYRNNEDWWLPIKSGEFRKWWEQNYGTRASKA